MGALAEQHIATYLTRDGRVFIVPQYPVPGDKENSEWSCPDFVALSYEDKRRPEVLVVEATTSSDSRPIYRKVCERKALWFNRIRAKLTADGIINDSWPMRFIGFVRRDNVIRLTRDFHEAADVTFAAIEDATFSWDYWERRKGGLT